VGPIEVSIYGPDAAPMAIVTADYESPARDLVRPALTVAARGGQG